MKQKRSFIYHIYREKDIKKIDDKINLFGVSKKFTTEYFMNFRLYSSMIVFLLIFVFANFGALLAPIRAAVWDVLGGYTIIDKPLKKRERKVDNEAYY